MFCTRVLWASFKLDGSREGVELEDPGTKCETRPPSLPMETKLMSMCVCVFVGVTGDGTNTVARVLIRGIRLRFMA